MTNKTKQWAKKTHSILEWLYNPIVSFLGMLVLSPYIIALYIGSKKIIIISLIFVLLFHLIEIFFIRPYLKSIKGEQDKMIIINTNKGRFVKCDSLLAELERTEQDYKETFGKLDYAELYLAFKASITENKSKTK